MHRTVFFTLYTFLCIFFSYSISAENPQIAADTHLSLIPKNILNAPVSIGELIDKMTILEIKLERITDEHKLENIRRELLSLQTIFYRTIQVTPELQELIQELKAANEALWETEDLIRDKEREGKFDEEFIRLARSVYIQNDERYRTKSAINRLLDSDLIEEKSYKPYN